MSAPRTSGFSLPPVVKSLGAVSFLNDLASEMMYPLLPSLVTQVLGGGAVTLGVLDGLSEAGAAGAKLASGSLADRPGWRRPLVVAGYLVAAVARPVIGLATAGWQVVAWRWLDRIGKGARTPPRDAMIADAAGAGQRGRAFGFHRAMDHAGAVAGPLIATALLTVGGLSAERVIVWTALPGAIAVGVVWWALYGPRAVPPSPLPRPNPSSLSLSGRRSPSPLFPLIVVFALARLPETLFVLRLHDLGLATALAPVLWAALHVVRTAMSYPGGRLSDALGPGRVMALGWGLYAVVCLGLAGTESVVVGSAWFLSLGLVAPATEPAERVFVAAQDSASRRGRSFGLYHAAVGLAALPGGLVLGGIYDRVGGPTALTTSAIAALVLVVVFLAVRARVDLVSGKAVSGG